MGGLLLLVTVTVPTLTDNNWCSNVFVSIVKDYVSMSAYQFCVYVISCTLIAFGCQPHCMHSEILNIYCHTVTLINTCFLNYDVICFVFKTIQEIM